MDSGKLGIFEDLVIAAEANILFAYFAVLRGIEHLFSKSKYYEAARTGQFQKLT